MKAVFDLVDVAAVDVFGEGVECVTWLGRRALRVEGGLVLARDVIVGDGSLEVDLGAGPGPAYPGIAFRAVDGLNYELVYVQPHTSGNWDAIQYDPVFNGGNTWQVFNGPRYQAPAQVPSGRWFTLRLDVAGSRAAVSVMDGSGTVRGLGQQPALTIARLVHDRPAGLIGVWTFKPAYFAQLRVGDADLSRLGAPGPAPALPSGAVTTWLLEGVGPVDAEENGTLNLDRYLAGRREATLVREFTTPRPGNLKIGFGFSDELELCVDDRRVFSGANTYSVLDSRQARGYIEPDANTVSVPAAAGRHVLQARLKASEPFGWGIFLALTGAGVELLPPLPR